MQVFEKDGQLVLKDDFWSFATDWFTCVAVMAFLLLWLADMLVDARNIRAAFNWKLFGELIFVFSFFIVLLRHLIRTPKSKVVLDSSIRQVTVSRDWIVKRSVRCFTFDEICGFKIIEESRRPNTQYYRAAFQLIDNRVSEFTKMGIAFSNLAQSDSATVEAFLTRHGWQSSPTRHL